MSKRRGILMAGLGLVVLGAAIGEHVYRRIIQRKYHEAVESRRQLERRFGDMLASHEQVKADLAQERQRSQGLEDALAAAQAQVEEAVARLTEETRTARALQLRLAAMQQQMDQLQGELAFTLENRHAADRESAQVQLDRIVVSSSGGAPLQGRVLSVHPEWNFVVIELGWDAVKIGETVSIFRENQLLAKARVERIQEGVCAATVLPEWKIVDVRVNDQARIL